MSDADSPQYGLPTPRDNDGKRKPVEFTYTFDDEEVTIKVIEPSITELEEYENLGEDVSYERLFEIIDQHLVEPTFDGSDDITGREAMCYITGIRQVGIMGGTALAEDVADALDERGDGPGN